MNMHTSVAVVFGIVVGLLIAALITLHMLMEFAASDLDGFRKWLDSRGVA